MTKNFSMYLKQTTIQNLVYSFGKRMEAQTKNSDSIRFKETNIQSHLLKGNPLKYQTTQVQMAHKLLLARRTIQPTNIGKFIHLKK